MLLTLILTALMGATGVILFEKWAIDDYMNTNTFWSRYWPAEACLLCRGFWFGLVAYLFLTFIPFTLYLFVPLAAIPIQVFLVKMGERKL
ncbi:hypothetical protein ACFS25_21230 [Spirosoma flavum]|uniref:DUF1360 domain-containing protein n=1 Tax=Spirosoma flavum TaxID=2048557 RepID=A0ABW6APG8_9BACT